MTKYRPNTEKIAKKAGKTNIYKTNFSNNNILLIKIVPLISKMDIE